MLDVELLAKHAARVALASSETVVRVEKSRRGGACMAIAGMGKAARVTVKKAGVEIDRKVLAQFAVDDSAAFARLAEVAKQEIA